MASTGCYQPLEPGSDTIRLLRVYPSEDDQAPLRGQLFAYPLKLSEARAHLYEALSYVWGSEQKPYSISINDQKLPITASLFEALVRLRDHFLERIIWINAICINQKDDREKENQIQLMAHIYGRANRVMVWLGPSADDSNVAIAAIRTARPATGHRPRSQSGDSSSSSDSSLDEPVHNQCGNPIAARSLLALLQRPWFNRIWVLQEVGTARHVHILCGSAEIDGYAFCLGVEALQSLFNHDLAVRGRIIAVTTLMRRSVFREIESSPWGLPGVDTRPLSELLAMYHTHKATQLHDKLYALLGMCSEDPDALETAKLLPDYSVPWPKLLQHICSFLLSKKTSVETWADQEVALIKSKGIVIGYVTGRDGLWSDEPRLSFETIPTWRATTLRKITLPARTILNSARPVRDGDLVLLLEDCSKFLVVRPCKDHFDVIFIGLKPSIAAELIYRTPSGERKYGSDLKWPEYLPMVESTCHDFDLVWDWNWDQQEYSALEERHTCLMEQDVVSVPQREFNRVVKMWNLVLALQNARKFSAAHAKILEIQEIVDGRPEEDRAQILSTLNQLARVSAPGGKTKHAGIELVMMLYWEFLVAPSRALTALRGNDVFDSDWSHRAVDFLLRCFRRDGDFKSGILEDAVHILPEESRSSAHEKYPLEYLQFLLDRIDVGSIAEVVLVQAASNSCIGTKIIVSLFERHSETCESTAVVVESAMENRREAGPILDLLIGQAGNKIPITDTMVEKMAKVCKPITLHLLLQGRDNLSATQAVIAAKARTAPFATQDFASLLHRPDQNTLDQNTERVVSEISTS